MRVERAEEESAESDHFGSVRAKIARSAERKKGVFELFLLLLAWHAHIPHFERKRRNVFFLLFFRVALRAGHDLNYLARAGVLGAARRMYTKCSFVCQTLTVCANTWQILLYSRYRSLVRSSSCDPSSLSRIRP